MEGLPHQHLSTPSDSTADRDTDKTGLLRLSVPLVRGVLPPGLSGLNEPLSWRLAAGHTDPRAVGFCNISLGWFSSRETDSCATACTATQQGRFASQNLMIVKNEYNKKI